MRLLQAVLRDDATKVADNGRSVMLLKIDLRIVGTSFRAAHWCVLDQRRIDVGLKAHERHLVHRWTDQWVIKQEGLIG